MKKPQSIDGFVPRRVDSRLGELHHGDVNKHARLHHNRKSVHSGNNAENLIGEQYLERAINRSGANTTIGNREDRLQRKDASRGSKITKRPRILKWFLILVVVVALAIGGYLLYKKNIDISNILGA